ncbi:MAG: transporter [Magnetococcales bacterium]|nr:transporter [Magnetococcales bacterium]
MGGFKQWRARALLAGLAGLAMIPGMSRAAVNDLFPGDYYPLPAGSQSVAFYVYERGFTGPYTRGVKTGNAELTSHVLALRYVRFFEAGGVRMAPVAVVNWASTSATPAAWAAALGGHAAGLGDPRLGLTVWGLNDKEAGRFLGVTGMVIPPLGDYDGHRLLNIGENRWRYVLNGGFISRLGDDVFLDLLPEFVWYGVNDDYAGGRRLEQEPSHALTGYLRYRWNPQWQVHLGGQWNGGGATVINGVGQNNPPENQRLMLGFTHLTDNKNQWMLRLAADAATENGYRAQRELALRYVIAF